MYTLMIWEHENSNVEIRENVELAFAYALASKGGFYKAQIINEFGVIDWEF